LVHIHHRTHPGCTAMFSEPVRAAQHMPHH
jgi:hypothetical protein